METADYKIVTLCQLIGNFDMPTSDQDAGLNTLYRKAINSIVAFAGDADSCPLEEFDKLIRNWMVSLRIRDFGLTTACDYLKSISGLHKRAVNKGLVPATDVFKTLRTLLKESGKTGWEKGLHISDFERFRSLVRAELAKTGQPSETGADIMLLSLLNGCIPVMDVAKLKIQEVPADNAAQGVMKRALKSSGREYLFPLKHGKRSPKQISEDVNNLVLDFLAKHNIKTFGTADNTLMSYWGFAALRAGVSPQAVASSFAFIPAGLPFLSLIGNVSPAEARNNDIALSVNSAFTITPMRWYAMHLRTRVTYEDLKQRFSDDRKLKMPETFYPSQEIATRVKKKIVFEDRPFIHNVVFFKSHYDDISPMFTRIGDIAWCYKTSFTDAGTYAPIHQRAFDEFQKAIGCFTPEFMAAHQSAEVLAIGDTVRILGGNLRTQTGTIKDIENNGPEGILTYLIDVCNKYAKSFTAHVDYRQVQKIPVKEKA